jgi:hypothetical protein
LPPKPIVGSCGSYGSNEFILVIDEPRNVRRSGTAGVTISALVPRDAPTPSSRKARLVAKDRVKFDMKNILCPPNNSECANARAYGAEILGNLGEEKKQIAISIQSNKSNFSSIELSIADENSEYKRRSIYCSVIDSKNDKEKYDSYLMLSRGASA